MAKKKATKLQLSLLIFTDGKTESQKRNEFPRLLSVCTTVGTIRTPIVLDLLLDLLLYDSAYSRNVLYLPYQPEFNVKEKQHSLLYTLYLGHNETDFLKDNLLCFLQNACGTKKKVLMTNSFVYTSFHHRGQF